MATDDGFLWQDKIFKSLSVIAREITGTRWSGPVFFGLKKSKAKQISKPLVDALLLDVDQNPVEVPVHD
jgi:hypothetical protein